MQKAAFTCGSMALYYGLYVLYLPSRAKKEHTKAKIRVLA
jgi:hypothetical protein